jgi:PAS domain S-box-containing protein
MSTGRHWIPTMLYRYGLALGLVVTALLITILFETYFEHAPAALFFCAVAVSSWFGGTGPGLVATLASGAVIYSSLLHPHELASEEIPRLVVFLFSGGMIALMGGAQRRAEEWLRRVRDELELKVQERTADLQRANRELQAEISERKEAEQALLSSEEQLKQAQAIAHLGSYEVDLLKGTSRWSDELFRILGRDPKNGAVTRQEFVDRIIHHEDRRHAMQSFHEAIHSGKSHNVQYRVMRPDGSVRFVQSMGEAIRDPDGAVIRFAGALLDITERKQAEDKLAGLNRTLDTLYAELAHVTRVTTLGEMTASIAHEVNQPLAAVVNNASACMRWLAGPAPNVEEARQSARLIIADGHRAGEIISRIRALVKKSPPRKDWLDINETILEVIALARSEVQGNRVALRTELSDELPLVLGDRIQLQQVILNLVMNGIEAMSAVTDRSRDLLIRSCECESDKVLVEVRDSGIGLQPESLDHLFKTFFTTKTKGMGMGLAISRSIIEAHGGRLWATPNTGQGATFQFTLPIGGEKEAPAIL